MKPQKINLSIIVVAYNEGRLIESCLKTLIHQHNAQDYEVLVVDDGSTDDSVHIMDAYNLRYENLKVIHKKNGGSISARFEGIRNANGKYITFVDADDFVVSNYVETINKITDLNKKIDLYQLNNFLKSPNSTSKYIEKDFLVNNSLSMVNEFCEWILTGKTGAVWDKIYKKELFNIERDTLSIFYGDDVYINLLYLRNVNTIMMIDIPIYVHNIGSITSGSKTDGSFHKLNDIDSLFKFIKLEHASKKYLELKAFKKFCVIYLVNIAKMSGELIHIGINREKINYKLRQTAIINTMLNNVKPMKKSNRLYIYCLKHQHYLAINGINKIRNYIKFWSKQNA